MFKTLTKQRCYAVLGARSKIESTSGRVGTTPSSEVHQHPNGNCEYIWNMHIVHPMYHEMTWPIAVETDKYTCIVYTANATSRTWIILNHLDKHSDEDVADVPAVSWDLTVSALRGASDESALPRIRWSIEVAPWANGQSLSTRFEVTH